ncbi:SagB/ThcOx family dehydrogenase [Magnetococcales bacterium HHB-1]
MKTILDYHQQTKHHPQRYAKGPGYLDWENQPDPFRVYDTPFKQKLPYPTPLPEISFKALHQTNQQAPSPLTLEHLSTFFQLSLAISAWKSYMGERWSLRCNPSSGNLHPTESYIILPKIEDTPSGVYHYTAKHHALHLRRPFEDIEAKNDHPSGFFLALTTIHQRETWKYGERSFRYCHLNFGHALAAISYAAATQGWSATLLPTPGDKELEQSLGLTENKNWEREYPGPILWIGKAYQEKENKLENLLKNIKSAPLLGTCAPTTTQELRRWPVVEYAETATEKPPTQEHLITPEQPSPGHTEHLTEKPAAKIILQRRSAVNVDPQIRLSKKQFFAFLSPLNNASMPPWNSIPWRSRIHPIFFIHRINDLTPGLYILPTISKEFLEQEMDDQLLWHPEQDYPNLYLLKAGDFSNEAHFLSCQQEIAGRGVFAAGFLADFDNISTKPWDYRRLHWEAGMLGQQFYLLAESMGLNGTGIGCFYDDLFHELLGLKSERFQTIYHFTIGKALTDNRLTTLPAY